MGAARRLHWLKGAIGRKRGYRLNEIKEGCRLRSWTPPSWIWDEVVCSNYAISIERQVFRQGNRSKLCIVRDCGEGIPILERGKAGHCDIVNNGVS